MNEGDRAWILGQLAEGERRAMTRLLAELRDLGIPSERALLNEVIAARELPDPAATSAPKPGGAADGADVERLERLARADPRVLAALLKEEPVLVIARLLRVFDWPWKEELLRALGSAVRLQVEHAISEETAPVGEGFRVHLLDGLARRVELGTPGVRGILRGRWKRGGVRS
jgi:hypothetical protein